MLGILRKVFHDRFFLGDAFRVLSCQFWSTVLQCGTWLPIYIHTHLKLLDRVVSGASFLTLGVFKCYFAHRLSVAVLYMMYKIRCNGALYGALPVPCVPVHVTRGA